LSKSLSSLALCITLAALIEGVINGALTFLTPLWFESSSNITRIGTFFAVGSALTSLIPIVLFVVMYFIGKRMALKQELRSVLLILLLGGWVGLFLGQTIAWGIGAVWFGAQIPSDPYFLPLELLGMLPQALTLLFPSFTALAIAYIRKTTGEQVIV
jgi:hypothetical protein